MRLGRLLSERPSYLNWLGIVLVLIGAYLVEQSGVNRWLE